MLAKEEEEVINSRIMESSDDLTRVRLTFFLLLAAGVKSLAVGREVVKLCVQVPHCTAGQCQDTGDVKGKPHLWELKRLDPVQKQNNMSKKNPNSRNPKDLVLCKDRTTCQRKTPTSGNSKDLILCKDRTTCQRKTPPLGPQKT